MNTRLENLFDRLESDRHRLLHRIRHLTPEQYNRSIGGKWSISQILSHLVTAERISRIYMSKKVLGIRDAVDTGIVEEGKIIVLKISQRLPFRFKAPQMVVDHTPAIAELQQLSIEWEKERLALKELLDRFQDQDINKKVYRHVRAGLLNIQHALIFLREHQIHHQPQIERIMRLKL